jgi:SPX domain protein involved in polyphosphate accumulation
VAELINSGMLIEVHKFSKFIHGCAVLLPEEVQAMPYWIDEPSIKDSIAASGADTVSDGMTGAPSQSSAVCILLLDR